jgi:prepilin-type N-terminal cleavage/methylation domain-containing protein
MEWFLMERDDPMTIPRLLARSAPARARAGMTLIEVILAVVIMSGAMLGLANFGRKFQHQTSDFTNQTLASDLATQRLEEIKGYRVYSTLVATFNGANESFATDSTYRGFTRTTAAVRTQVAAGATPSPPGNDYITVTVTVTGNSMPVSIKKTTVIALF